MTDATRHVDERQQPRLEDVRALLETVYPPAWAESWDRVGLVVGEPSAVVSRVLLAVDPTVDVASEASEHDLLITHHPLLLRGVSALPGTSGKGAVVSTLIRAGTALWCGHTNADRARTGTATALADALELTERRPLVEPEHEADGLIGLGLIGTLDGPSTVGEVAARLAKALPRTVQGAKFTGPADRSVRRVALCPGAGDSLLETAVGTDADVFVTSDLRHHPALEHLESAAAPQRVPALIDVPHWASESLWLPLLATVLQQEAALRGWSLEVRISGQRTDPWSDAIRP